MIQLKALAYKLSNQINDFPVTYRWFIAAMFVALMYAITELVVLVFSLNTLDKIKEQEQTFIENATQFKNDLVALEALAKQPEKEILERKIQDINQEIQLIDQDIELITKLLIDPKTMTTLLDNIVKKQSNLSLMSLKSVDHIRQEDLGLYQHQIEITLEGSFLDIAKYLHDLEAMPFKVYWKSIEYRTINDGQSIPRANVVLKIYTLSREGGWLGV